MRSVDKDADADLEEVEKSVKSPDPPSPEEMFERFREIARKVVQIPKSVIVEREREWKAAREEKKALRNSQSQLPEKEKLES